MIDRDAADAPRASRRVEAQTLNCVSSRALATAAAAALTPVSGVLGLAVVVSTSASSGTAAVSAAALVCTYSYPDPGRIAETMASLTVEPVREAQWDRYSSLIGIDHEEISWTDSSPKQRRSVLEAGVESILFTRSPAAVTTPAMVWWLDEVRPDADDSWRALHVPGWEGDLDSYLTALLERYALDSPFTDQHECVQPFPTSCAQPSDLAAILATIRHLESADNYVEQRRSLAAGYTTRSGNPSGAYQFLATTWNSYGGYGEAFMAPPAIQDERAGKDVQAILDAFDGDPAWVPVAWYVGMSGAKRVRDGTWSTAYVPNPAHNTVSIGEYQARWLDHYTNVALADTSTRTAECPSGGTAAVAWAETQIGAPYAAIDPYRFGAPAWPGGVRIGSRNNRYNFPAGTVVYDCSGFVIAAWRAAGVDLVALYGLYGSQAFPRSPLPEIADAAIAPGDLAVYSPRNEVGHIVMIHHIDANGTVHTIEATPSLGVALGTIDWSRVISIKRPSTAATGQN